MTVKKFTVNPFQMNCYIYYDDTSKKGVIIDPGAYDDFEKSEIIEYIKKNDITIELILNTHGHIDHILGNDWAYGYFNKPIIMHKDDLPLIEQSITQAELFGLSFPQPPIPHKFINENETINFSNTELKIIHTPGHSPGSICFVDINEKLIFAGDTVFSGSIGRTDLWMGDYDLLISSIKNKILTLPDDFIIYPGHMENTAIGVEKKSNPFLI